MLIDPSISLSFSVLIFSDVVSTRVSFELIKTDVSFSSFCLFSNESLKLSSFFVNSSTFAGILFVPVLLGTSIDIRQYELLKSTNLTFALVVSVWACDSAAFIFGTSFGDFFYHFGHLGSCVPQEASRWPQDGPTWLSGGNLGPT